MPNFLTATKKDGNLNSAVESPFGGRKIVLRGEYPDQAMSVVRDTGVIIIRKQSIGPIAPNLLEKIFEGSKINLTEPIGVVVDILPTGLSGTIHTYTLSKDAAWHNKENIPFSITSSVGLVQHNSTTVESVL